MERLPYIDEHAITVDADRDDTWSALLKVLCRNPQDPSTVPAGFVLDEARRPERFALKGRHAFAVYRWVFELDSPNGTETAGRTRLRAITWAAFPGLHGKIYRALVIGTGGHRAVTRLTLRRMARAAVSKQSETAADYVDVFEAPLQQPDSRSAEQMLRDAVGGDAGGGVVMWIHRHVLRFRLGPYSTPDHLIGWPIVRSDHDAIVLATGGAADARRADVASPRRPAHRADHPGALPTQVRRARRLAGDRSAASGDRTAAGAAHRA